MLRLVLLAPVLAASVTLSADRPTREAGATTAALLRRESSPRATAAEVQQTDTPVTMAFAVASNADSAAGSNTESQVLSSSALKAAVLAAEAYTDVSKPHGGSGLAGNPLHKLPDTIAPGSAYYFDPESGVLNFLGRRGEEQNEVTAKEAAVASDSPLNATTIWTQIGPPGATGARGPEGTAGPDGSRGPDGIDFHDDIDLTSSRGPPGPAGPEGPAGDHGVHGERGPPGPSGTKGARGNFTLEQEKEFAQLTRRLSTALVRADAMDEMEHLVLSTRLTRLKTHFGDLEKNLTAEEVAARAQKAQAEKKMKDVEAINAVTINASAAVAEAKSAEENLLKRQAKLKDEILTITQEEQTVMNAPLPPGSAPAPCPPSPAQGRRQHYGNQGYR